MCGIIIGVLANWSAAGPALRSYTVRYEGARSLGVLLGLHWHADALMVVVLYVLFQFNDTRSNIWFLVRLYRRIDLVAMANTFAGQ